MTPRPAASPSRRRGRRAAPAATRDVAAVLDGLRRLVHSLRRGDRAVERRLQLGSAQLYVLHHLAEAPAGSVNELAERTLTHQSSVSLVVSRLVERGLVRREPSADDRRRQVLTLTRDGRAIVRRAPVVPQLRLLESIRRLGREDVRTLRRLLETLLGTMGADGARAAMFFESEDASREAARRGGGRRPASRGGK